MYRVKNSLIEESTCLYLFNLRSVLTRILFFFFPEAEYSYFSADFRQKVFLRIFLHFSVRYLCLWF